MRIWLLSLASSAPRQRHNISPTGHACPTQPVFRPLQSGDSSSDEKPVSCGDFGCKHTIYSINKFLLPVLHLSRSKKIARFHAAEIAAQCAYPLGIPSIFLKRIGLVTARSRRRRNSPINLKSTDSVKGWFVSKLLIQDLVAVSLWKTGMDAQPSTERLHLRKPRRSGVFRRRKKRTGLLAYTVSGFSTVKCHTRSLHKI